MNRVCYVCMYVSSSDSKPAYRYSLVPGKTPFFRALGSKKVMKDFAEKQTAVHVRLISGQGF
jgi:hypothetical protein